MSSDRYFLTAGARLRYRDEGAGPAILLVHGWTLDLQMWDPQADNLRRHLRIIRFDRRGCGLSSGAPDVRQDATDAIALCRHLDVHTAGGVGASQGARVVLKLAQLAPQFLSRCVLDSPPNVFATADSDADDLDYNGLKALAQREGLEAFRREWARHPLTALATADPGPHRLLEQMIARYRGLDLLSTPGTGPVPPADFEPGHITQPVLVLNGALDTPARLGAGQALARTLPRCERVIVPIAGHLANLDNPEAYNTLLLRFFCQHP